MMSLDVITGSISSCGMCFDLCFSYKFGIKQKTQKRNQSSSIILWGQT